MKTKKLTQFAAAACLMFASSQAIAFDARDIVAKAMEPASDWNFTSGGVKAQEDKTIVYIAANLRNSGILSVAEGVREAVNEMGWTLEVVDTRGEETCRQTALETVLESKPDGLILGGFNATDHADTLWDISEGGTQIIGWHAASKPGEIANTPVKSNITTDPMEVAQVAAAYAIDITDEQAGAVIFTDTRFGIAVAKSDEMARVIETCETCAVLEVVDLPLDQTATEMPKAIKRLHETYGDRWNVSLGINDLYFDDAIIELSVADPEISEQLTNISAGDGSVSAYQRIESELFQSATVPEPLNFQGWQIIDELNRSFAGMEPGNFVAPTKLVTLENVQEDGGQTWRFDPENGYKEAFRSIWEQ